MKKLFAIFIAFVTLFCVTGCRFFNKDNEKDKKYDVTIKVTSDQGGEWIFTPDVKELNIKIPYDGLERRFYVSLYQINNHPELGAIWFIPTDRNGFKYSMQIKRPTNDYETIDNAISERGEYHLTIKSNMTDSRMRSRTVYLRIFIV